jgi:WD40 repeat protein
MVGNQKTERGDESERDSIPPGFKLRHTLRGHKAWIGRIAWSPDGRTLASPSSDKTLRLWDTETGEELRTLNGHDLAVYGVVWSRDGRMLASGSADSTIRLWDAETGKVLRTLKGHDLAVYSVKWSPVEQTLASGSSDSTIQLWDAETGKVLRTFVGHSTAVYSVAWSPDGLSLASGSVDSTIRLWDAETGKELRKLKGNSGAIPSVAWSPDGQKLASGSVESTIHIWDAKTGRQTNRLEGHTSDVTSVSFSSDGCLLASKSIDGTVRLWRCDTWETVAVLPESTHKGGQTGLSFHPKLPVLATLGEEDKVIRIWDLDLSILLKNASDEPPVRYTTAKIVLVGESGVGKTGLGWRLAHGVFKEHPSSHGQQFWVLNSLQHKRPDGTACEAVLWDLAGQPDYRLIHALFLDDAELALVLFDPTNRQDPFHGVEYWLKALSRGQGRRCHTILVGARTDRGDPTLTSDEIDAFCRAKDITGGYIGTSALTGHGLDELIARMKALIAWDDKTAIVTTASFKRIKEYVKGLKEGKARTKVLTDPEGLRTQLQETDPSWSFTDAEMMTAVGHLANRGYVCVLRTSSGSQAILLEPDLLNNLAASFVQKARGDSKGLGALDEARVLSRQYTFPELSQLSEHEQQTILIDTATVLLLEHNICFRESLGSQTLLIFPELINRKKPPTEEVETVDDVSYRVTGQVENVYAALVVLLGYTSVFTRTDQWQNQAQYEVDPGQVCAFRQWSEREGEIEFVLSYGPKVKPSTRLLFQGLFEKILDGRQVSMTRFPPLACPKCGDLQERTVVVKRTLAKRSSLFCSNCGKKIDLPEAGEVIALSPEVRAQVEQERATADLRTKYEAALVKVKSLARERKLPTPNCFVSYAWGVPEHESWVEKLWTDLKNAEIDAILDRRVNKIGDNLARFVSLIETLKWIIVVGTPLYRQKYENKLSTTGRVVAAEVDLINLRLLGTQEQKASVLPVLLDGDDLTSFPPLLRGKVYADFRREECYFAALFDLILALYDIPFDDPGIVDLRESLRSAAECE